MHAARLRLHLQAALGLAPLALSGCKAHDVVTDTDGAADTDGAPDTDADTDVATDTDVVSDTDVATDTDVVSDTDVATDTDSALVTCDPAPDGNAFAVGGGVADGFTTFRVCLDLTATAPGCLPAFTSGGPTSTDLTLAFCLNADASCAANNPILAVQCGPYDHDGACCYNVTPGGIAIGRPFATDDGFRTARPVRGSGWRQPAEVDVACDAEAATAWTAIGLGEHASVASFASFVLDLMALGAPAELLRDAALAMADEVAHAELAFGLASAMGGQGVAPGPLPTSQARRRATPEAVLRAVIEEGCVGETVAAHDASVRRDLGTLSAVRQALTTIADDESRHAALAWRTAQWILSDHPHLLPVADQAFVDAVSARRALAPTDEPHRPAVGLIDAATQREASGRALDRVVLPMWRALRQTFVGTSSQGSLIERRA